MTAKAIEVIGRVQGVFFRVSAHEIANGLGIKGWVRNLQNGNVLIHAEGDEKQLSKMMEWCKKGPPRAHVERIEVNDTPVRNYESFEILK